MSNSMTPVYQYEVIKAKTGDVEKLKTQLDDLGAGGWELTSAVFDPHGRGVILFLKRGYWVPGPEAEDENEQAAKEAYSGMTEAVP